MYGSNGKIGLLEPAGNRVILPEFYRVAPPGIAFFETRMVVQGDWISEASNFSMIDNAGRGLAELKICNVDVCVLACTATSFLKGRKWDQAFVAEGQKELGIPVTTTTLSLLEALKALMKKRIAIASPWAPEINRRAVVYLEESGFEVVHAFSDPVDRIRVNDQMPEFTYSLASKADAPSAEAICIFATDLRSIEVLSSLEKDLKKPVISSNQAILFNALRILNYNQMIPGFGSLLEKSRINENSPDEQGGSHGTG
jgi:maleate cis-trans isomerase